MAVKTKHRRLHLEIQQHRSNPVGLIRSSFRKNGKVCHSTHGRITGLSLEQLRLIQAAFQGRVVPESSPEALQIISGREYGASAACIALAKELGLDRIIYSRNEPWVRSALALIVGRLVYAGSELVLSHLSNRSALWELCGVGGRIDVDRDCYAVMDRLLDRQGSIQRSLAARHLQDGSMVLYDLTSSYVEGDYQQSEIIAFGYNRDGKRRHQQMVIGLLCNGAGCPVGVEVFRGNTQDATTVAGKIAELQTQYGLKEIIFVGDGGLITRANDKELAGVEGLHTISALTHPQILELLQRAFRNLRTVLLEQRPVPHENEDQIRADVFICMLAYYLQWHMEQRLAPLFASDGRGKNRKWTFSSVMKSLQQITINPARIGKVEFEQVTVPTAEQQRILDLLGVKLCGE